MTFSPKFQINLGYIPIQQLCVQMETIAYQNLRSALENKDYIYLLALIEERLPSEEKTKINPLFPYTRVSIYKAGFQLILHDLHLSRFQYIALYIQFDELLKHCWENR